MTVAVVFLARGIGGGLASLKGFLESYSLHPAGLVHDLVILLKGWEDPEELLEAEGLVRAAGARPLTLPDDGFDWGAYSRAAAHLPHEFACFLNTHSRIRADGWLSILRHAIATPGVGMVGATGSWGTFCPGLHGVLPAVRALRRLSEARQAVAFAARSTIGLASWYRYYRRFPRFPNPHLRSNAFLIRLAHFRQFCASSPAPTTKEDAFAMESGASGLTRWFAANALSALVAGGDGRTFAPDGWPESGTFRSPGQPNLLVSDNQTRTYDSATPAQRAILEAVTWGRVLSLPSPEARGR